MNAKELSDYLKELGDYLREYGDLKSEEETARDTGDFARVTGCQRACDLYEQKIAEYGLVFHCDEGHGIWTLALRDQVDPEWEES